MKVKSFPGNLKCRSQHRSTYLPYVGGIIQRHAVRAPILSIKTCRRSDGANGSIWLRPVLVLAIGGRDDFFGFAILERSLAQLVMHVVDRQEYSPASDKNAAILIRCHSLSGSRDLAMNQLVELPRARCLTQHLLLRELLPSAQR
jgi:hypothetical protein